MKQLARLLSYESINKITINHNYVPGKSFFQDLISFFATDATSLPEYFCLILLTDRPTLDFCVVGGHLPSKKLPTLMNLLGEFPET